MKKKISENWIETLFRDIGMFSGGGTPSTTNPAYWNGSIQWTTSKRLGDSLYLDSGERTISDNALKESSTTLIPKGNLLVGTRVGTGKIVVNRIDVAISQDLTGVIVDKRKYLPEFIAYQTREQRLQDCFRKQKRGVTIQGVSRDDLKDFILYVPPLDEQRKIAVVLLKIQNAIEIQESIIERTRELKKSTLHHVFTHGLHGEKLKDTEIGPMPASWDMAKIGTAFDIKQGKSLSSRKQTGAYLKPFLRTSNVLWGRLDLSRLDEMDFTTDERKALTLVYGDLLVCEGGDIGRTAMWRNEKVECYYQNHLHRLRNKDEKTNPLFIMYWMQLALTQLGVYEGLGNKTTIPNLSSSRLKEFIIPVPGKKEQQEIARIIEIIDEKIELHTTRKSALQDLFKTMLNKLMTGEIRVKDLDIDASEVTA